MKRLTYPKEVPVLTEADIIKGDIGSGQKHCLVGWVDEVFGSLHYQRMWSPVWRELDKITGSLYPVGWNDNPRRPKREIAQAFNQMTANLGYTEGNPCKPIKSKKRKSP